MATKSLKKVSLLLALMLAISSLTIACTSSSKYSKSDLSPTSTESESSSQTDKSGTNKQQQTNSASDDSTQANKPADKNLKVRALYLTGWTVGSMDKVKHFIDLTKTTEINSYVIDIKDDDGYVGYESSIPEVRQINGWQKKYDVDKVIQAFHENNVHLIGRIVCFKDPVLASKRADLAIKNAGGGMWRDNHGKPWLDPYNKDCWPYLIEIAKEGIKKGFDEIQFDYVRFANDGPKKAMHFEDNGKKKYEAIDEFLSYARKELQGVTLSADVFGIICESPGDAENIGQNLEFVGKELDYISPMVYPSHYAVGQKVNGVTYMKPDMDPYGVVYNSLAKAKNRISKVEGYKANIRPYLQDFTATWLGKGYYQTYGDEQVKQQIKAVYDAGYDQWILWDAGNAYSEDAFQKRN